MKKIYLTLSLILSLAITSSLMAQTKKEKDDIGYAMSLLRSARTMAQGKMKESLSQMVRISDSLKTVGLNDPEVNERYFGVLNMQANVYLATGDFYNAEKLTMQQLERVKSLKEPDKTHSYKQQLKQLADIYDKMGRDVGSADIETKNERVLEELVIANWGDLRPKKDELQEFYTFFIKTYYQGAKLPADDSIAFIKQYEPYFQGKLPPVGASKDQDARSVAMMIQGYKAILQQQYAAAPDLPIDDHIKLLKTGKFKFRNDIMGVTIGDIWEETRRLSALYLKEHNYVAAEALIKQAIKADDTGPATNPLGSYNSDVIMMSLDAVGKMAGDGSMMESVKSALKANNKVNGVDINYVKNKALLAQIYKATGRTVAYKGLTDSIVSLGKKLEDSTNPTLINNLGGLYLSLGRNKEAAAVYKKLTDNWTKQGNSSFVPMQLNIFRELAKADRTIGDDAGAEAALKKAMELYKKSGWETFADYKDIALDLARLYENTGRFAAAEQLSGSVLGPYFNNIKDNFGYLSEHEKLEWLNSQISALDLSVSLLRTDPNAPSEFVRQVYDQQLQLKGLVLTDQEKIFNAVRKSGTPQVKKLVEQWKSTRAALSWHYTQPATPRVLHFIDSLTTIANVQEKQLNELSATLKQLRNDQQVGFKQIQQKLSATEVAVEFVKFNYYRKKQTDSVWYGAFVIRSGDVAPHFVPLFEEGKLAGLLKGDISSEQFAKGFYGDGKTATTGAGSLYTLIFKPLQNYLKGADKLDIAPTGLLNHISFKALPAGGTPLADLYKEVRMYSSVRAIAQQQKTNTSATNNAVLYGGIKYGTADSSIPQNERTSNTGKVWTSLKTGDEIARIDSLFKANKVSGTALTEYAATEESLKQLSSNAPRILHIATHGYSFPKPIQGAVERGTQFSMAADPMLRSGIIMANANKVWSGGLPVQGKDDGIVTAYEIADLDLSNTDLVVLSACGTALGDVRGSEGTFGLQRAFKLAGVSNMLLSLWDLPDAETILFMKAFYANKIVKNLADHQALKQAQDEFRKTRSPYYWAGFVLIE